MSLNKLVEISRYYGKNPDYVLAGGGNTSWKDADTLYVKGSGFSLADAEADSFVKMKRNTLDTIMGKTYPDDGDPFGRQRESAVLADMMAARMPGEENKRPSVETLLHNIMPFAYVVHLHPALVNGVTCSVRGEETIRDIFGNEAVWIPSINPGYILSLAVNEAIDAYKAKYNKQVSVIFLQNHGVFVSADTQEGIKDLYEKIISKINVRVGRKPDFSENNHENTGVIDVIKKIINTLSQLAGYSIFTSSNEIIPLVKDRESFYPVSSAFTPDHIVYAGSHPLFAEYSSDDGFFLTEWKNHVEKTGRNPRIVAVKGLGVFSASDTEKGSRLALELFKDAVKIAVYAENFGGPLFMTEDKINFINNWEAERFRTRLISEKPKF